MRNTPTCQHLASGISYLASGILAAVAIAFAGTTFIFADDTVNGELLLPPAPPSSFSIAVIPDTQHYLVQNGQTPAGDNSAVANQVFDAYTRWIVENLERQRIVFVSHVGDIVDKNTHEQWNVARRCMDRLHGLVPYGISVGNHDMTSDGDSSLFQEFFPRSRFDSFDWYGGSYENEQGNQATSGNNANSFQLFSAAGLDFIILHVECNAPDNVLDWVDDVLTMHSDYRAIVTTHMYLGPREKPAENQGYFDDPKGKMLWKKCHGEHGNSPQQMWDKCFSKHKNLFMILCGDQSRTQAMRITEKGQHGNLVHTLLSDYGRHGLRIYSFRPEQNEIRIATYNPILKQLCTGTRIVPDRQEHQFMLRYDMSVR